MLATVSAHEPSSLQVCFLWLLALRLRAVLALGAKPLFHGSGASRQSTGKMLKPEGAGP